MRNDFEIWMERQGYAENTRGAQLHRVGKVEKCYGPIDDLIASNTFEEVIRELTYSTEDERLGRPNPSRIQFNGNIRNNLASYKNAALRYGRFLEETDGVPLDDEGDTEVEFSDRVATAQPERHKLALERDMQAALRRDILSLGKDLSIVDDGVERSVASGYIDILCENEAKDFVVVELKAGQTDPRVIAQILGYMGDLLEEEPARSVAGIIVAHEFDRRTIAAARAIPNLRLMKYHVHFSFSELGIAQ
ncbi:endonuclease NucS domain-containing protein [Antarctobacter sp.]|uniref:endonuclease NucS domain-containing protein n=1 Tax=Antarctobacter sp. TaxID=1872577 RepID=UPI003A8E6F41